MGTTFKPPASGAIPAALSVTTVTATGNSTGARFIGTATPTTGLYNTGGTAVEVNSDNTISLVNADTGVNAILSTALYTNNRTLTFPDATGVIGLKVGVPASAGASGKVGTWAADATFFYACIAANTWVRAVLATF